MGNACGLRGRRLALTPWILSYAHRWTRNSILQPQRGRSACIDRASAWSRTVCPSCWILYRTNSLTSVLWVENKIHLSHSQTWTATFKVSNFIQQRLGWSQKVSFQSFQKLAFCCVLKWLWRKSDIVIWSSQLFKTDGLLSWSQHVPFLATHNVETLNATTKMCLSCATLLSEGDSEYV